MCRGAISIDTLVEVPPDYSTDRENEVILPAQQWYSSSKVRTVTLSLYGKPVNTNASARLKCYYKLIRM